MLGILQLIRSNDNRVMVAQMALHLIHNQKVVGSNLAGSNEIDSIHGAYLICMYMADDHGMWHPHKPGIDPVLQAAYTH